MHLTNHEGLLISVASVSFAMLVFMFIYLLFLDDENDANQGKDVLVNRPVLLARAIGHDNISH